MSCRLRVWVATMCVRAACLCIRTCCVRVRGLLSECQPRACVRACALCACALCACAWHVWPVCVRTLPCVRACASVGPCMHAQPAVCVGAARRMPGSAAFTHLPRPPPPPPSPLAAWCTPSCWRRTCSSQWTRWRRYPLTRCTSRATTTRAGTSCRTRARPAPWTSTVRAVGSWGAATVTVVLTSPPLPHATRQAVR
jgi:hypothetical protein